MLTLAPYHLHISECSRITQRWDLRCIYMIFVYYFVHMDDDVPQHVVAVCSGHAVSANSETDSPLVLIVGGQEPPHIAFQRQCGKATGGQREVAAGCEWCKIEAQVNAGSSIRLFTFDDSCPQITRPYLLIVKCIMLTCIFLLVKSHGVYICHYF